MVDDERAVGAFVGLGAYLGVKVDDFPCQRVEVGPEIGRVFRVDAAHGLADVVGNAQGVGRRRPCVRVGCAAFRYLQRFDAFRRVDHNKVLCIGSEAFHPCALEAKVAGFYVQLAFGQRGHLLCRGFVSLGAGSVGHHCHDVKPVAANLFGEVSQGFDSHGYRWLFRCAICACGKHCQAKQ